MGIIASNDQRTLGYHRQHRHYLVALRFIILLALPFTIGACCQTSYIVESAYHQAELLRRRVPISKVLKDPTLSPKERDKLLLAQQARQFAEQKIGLRHTGNYTT